LFKILNGPFDPQSSFGHKDGLTSDEFEEDEEEIVVV